MSGAQNLDPLPATIRDDAGLVAWRTLCASRSWTCDTIIDDFRTQDVLQLLASCGYARPYQSDLYGVAVDKDRSSDAPTQVFSRRNANNIRFERAFPRVPAGFIVNYRDRLLDEDEEQIEVYQRDPTIGVPGLLETVSYDGLIDAAKVTARALFDLDQGNLRSTFYYLDSDVETLVCRKADLVAIQFDILSKYAGDGIIRSKIMSGSNITGFVIDGSVPITSAPDMHATTDLHAVADMHLVGYTTGIAIRRNDGTISTHQISNASSDTDTLTLSTPIADPGTIVGLNEGNGTYGCMLTVGRVASEYRRVLVSGITPTKGLMCTLTLVDEAPALVRY